MAKGDEPRDKHQHWNPARAGTPASTTFAGNIMAMVAMALLFDDGGATDNDTEVELTPLPGAQPDGAWVTDEDQPIDTKTDKPQ